MQRAHGPERDAGRGEGAEGGDGGRGGHAGGARPGGDAGVHGTDLRGAARRSTTLNREQSVALSGL